MVQITDLRTLTKIKTVETRDRFISFLLRWEQTPLSEAVRFKHLPVAQYLRDFILNNPDQGLHGDDAYDNGGTQNDFKKTSDQMRNLLI